MKLLALDTSTLACSVALEVDGEVSARHVVEARRHRELLLPMIAELLGEAGIESAGLDAVVLGNGPGSFIGMRIAASVAQGLCFAGGAALVPVSSLAAVAAEALAGSDCPAVLVAQDARMNEVYLAGFERGPEGRPVPSLATRLHPADAPIEGAGGYGRAGAGWSRYPSLAAASGDGPGPWLGVEYPCARWLLEPGRAALAAGGAVAPEALEPEYVRVEVAAVPGRGATPGDSRPRSE